MKKAFRQAQIGKLIRAKPILTQDELAAELAVTGIQTSQVTLSRDIRELGIVKTPEGYRERNSISPSEPPRENLRRVLQEFLRDVQVAQNLVVLKTTPGGASAVGLALDAAEDWPELVGTVAGDDTLFAATPSARAAKKLQKTLLEVW